MNFTETFQPMFPQFWPAVPNSCGFGLSQQYHWAMPIAAILVSTNENMRSPGETFRFYRALPNVFVGLGLLLTFFGLVSALHFATGGIAEGSNFEQTQASLRGLLQAASFKFYTSVAGLAASLLLGLVIRWGISSIEKGFARLSQALEERLCVRPTHIGNL